MKKFIFLLTIVAITFLAVPVSAQVPDLSAGAMISDVFSMIWAYIKAHPTTFAFIFVAYEGVVRWLASEKTYSVVTWIYKIFKFIQNFFPDVKAKAADGTPTETHL